MLARAATAQGAKNFVHVSALAADLDSPSRWAQTKVIGSDNSNMPSFYIDFTAVPV